MAFTLNYVPHGGQRRIHRDRSIRFRTICCGRRWGKTKFAAAELLDTAGLNGGLYAWIAPTYFICERGIKAIREIGGELVKFAGQNPVRATFVGAGGPVEILFLSADNPDTIIGDGYDGIVVDEAARIPKTVWDVNIRPSLGDKRGWAILISTPRGRNWFFDTYTRGQSGDEPLYRSYTFSSRDNPYFSEEEWIEMKRTMPEDVFRQEMEAQFLEDSAGVFRNVDACTFQGEGRRSGDSVTGLDLAKHHDFTVQIDMDRVTGVCYGFDRFNQLSWPVQKDRIWNHWKSAGGLLVMDATGVGDPIYDDLVQVIPSIEPVKLTNASKAQLIQRLACSIEQREISWPAEWTVLTNELKRYEYEMSEKGVVTYNAPSGFFDDCVIALALANSARQQYLFSGTIKTFASPAQGLGGAGPRSRLRTSGRTLRC